MIQRSHSYYVWSWARSQIWFWDKYLFLCGEVMQFFIYNKCCTFSSWKDKWDFENNMKYFPWKNLLKYKIFEPDLARNFCLHLVCDKQDTFLVTFENIETWSRVIPISNWTCLGRTSYFLRASNSRLPFKNTFFYGTTPDERFSQCSCCKVLWRLFLEIYPLKENL